MTEMKLLWLHEVTENASENLEVATMGRKDRHIT